MFVKSATLALVALVASAAAQNATQPLAENTVFTQPIGEAVVYTVGDVPVLSWRNGCGPGSAIPATTPASVDVDFYDSTEQNGAVFKSKVATIDCSTKTSDNVKWNIPSDIEVGGKKMYSLKITLPGKDVWSGRFRINAKGSPSGNPTPTPSGDKTAGAGILAPAMAGAALMASAALLVL